MSKKTKKQLCEHSWKPELFTSDDFVYGIEDEKNKEVFLESSIIIVRCLECNKYGFVFGETFDNQ